MLAWDIARRYLFAPKSHAAINVITLVAAGGIAVITTALICTLSVYNGFAALVGDLCSHFDPDLRIEARAGKSFAACDSTVRALAAHPAVAAVSTVVEETVLLAYDGRQVPAVMKGVDEAFADVTGVTGLLRSGSYDLGVAEAAGAVMGAGVAAQVGVGAGFVRPVSVYCPRREGRWLATRADEAFREEWVFCNGTFAVEQMEYDDRYFLTSLAWARRLLADSTLTTAYEVRLRTGVAPDRAKRALAAIVGPDFTLLTAAEQQADSFRMMQIEKWITFLIIAFILLIASFNIIGALSMLIIDKEAEITTLRTLGADDRLVRRIFLYEGWLISGSGAVVGIVVGIALCLLQEHCGLISLGDGSGMFIIDSYPVRLQWGDVGWTLACVGVVGFVATLYPLGTLHTRQS